jgi:hypothetical protein
VGPAGRVVDVVVAIVDGGVVGGVTTVVVGTVTDTTNVVVTDTEVVEGGATSGAVVEGGATSDEVPQPPAINANIRASDTSGILGRQSTPKPCRIRPVDHRSDPAGPRV